jgi:hypothetical protein
MKGVSKKSRDGGSDAAGADVPEPPGTDVPGETGTDISERRIERDDRSNAQYYVTLLISAGIWIVAMICLLAVMEVIYGGRPAD